MVDYSSVKNEIINIELYNSIGQKVRSYVSNNSTNININKNKLKPDVYFIKLNTTQGVITKKVVI